MNLFVLRTWLEAKFAKDERGASMVEYILLVALIALAVIAAVVFLKDQVNGKFNDAGVEALELGQLNRRPSDCEIAKGPVSGRGPSSLRQPAGSLHRWILRTSRSRPTTGSRRSWPSARARAARRSRVDRAGARAR